MAMWFQMQNFNISRLKRYCTLTSALLALTQLNSCRSRANDSKVTARPAERKLIGPGVEYEPIGGSDDLSERTLAETLASSFPSRRNHGWEVFKRIIRPVPLKVGASDSLQTIPLFQTWYDSGEIEQIFAIFLRKLREQGLNENADLPRRQILLEETWKEYHAQSDIAADRDSFLFARFETLLGQVTRDPARIGGLNGFGASSGINGRGTALFSPQLVKSYILNYASVIRCQEIASTQQDQNSEAPGKTLKNRPYDGNLTGALSIALQRFADDNFGECFAQPLPRGAASVKLTWTKVAAPGDNAVTTKLANFDTSISGINAMFTKGGTWRIADQMESPEHPRTLPIPELAANKIYRVKNDKGHEWVLTAMHVTTRETKEWVWASFWWGGSTSNQDFGADRPTLCTDQAASARRDPQPPCRELITTLAPWANYKMCTLSTWREGDPVMNQQGTNFERALREASWPQDIKDAAQANHAAYKQSRHAPDDRYYTWCSNPFIEFEEGTANSNCVGCHQFAGPGRKHVPEAHNRLDKMTKDFPADFLWSFDEGNDHTAARIHAVFSSGY